jgi:hypothetical protein
MLLQEHTAKAFERADDRAATADAGNTLTKYIAGKVGPTKETPHTSASGDRSWSGSFPSSLAAAVGRRHRWRGDCQFRRSTRRADRRDRAARAPAVKCVVIDTIGKKAVLILGRFTADRKTVLDAIREELRKRDYLPILFDFGKPASQDLTATVSTLAHLARFIIADLTDPSSIPHELVVPTTPVPIQPIILSGNSEFAMFQDLRRRHPWVLTTHRYDS